MADLTIYQFPVSHYCEKVRWILDHKQLPYAVENQFPGLHAPSNRRRVGVPTVPVLVDGQRAIGDSSQIAFYLDERYPEQRLIPGSGDERTRVLAIETEFDEEIGPAVRRLAYSYLLREPSLFRAAFFGAYRGIARWAGSVAAGFVAREIGKMYRVGEGSVEESLVVVERGFARLEQLCAGERGRYLVGDAFSLADITVASLLAPTVAPPNSPWANEFPIPDMIALRDRLRARRGGAWILARYERDRRRARSTSSRPGYVSSKF